MTFLASSWDEVSNLNITKIVSCDVPDTPNSGFFDTVVVVLTANNKCSQSSLLDYGLCKLGRMARNGTESASCSFLEVFLLVD